MTASLRVCHLLRSVDFSWVRCCFGLALPAAAGPVEETTCLVDSSSRRRLITAAVLTIAAVDVVAGLVAGLVAASSPSGEDPVEPIAHALGYCNNAGQIRLFLDGTLGSRGMWERE